MPVAALDGVGFADRAVGATVECREKLLVSIASQPLTDSSPSLLNLS